MNIQKVAMVTGGAGSFGSAIAQRLHEDGFFVVISDANLDQAQQVASTLTNSLPVRLDVTDSENVEDCLQMVIEKTGRLDVLVNNAGIGFSGDSVTAKLSEFDQTIAVNLRGVYLVTRAAIQHLEQAASPRVIMIGSRTWLAGGNPAYTASKAGVVGLARTLTQELGPRNGTCNVVAPGPVDTAFVDNMKLAQREANFQRYEEITPMGRNAKPEDVAGAVSFFAGPDSGYISGEVLHIAGGLQLAPKL